MGINETLKAYEATGLSPVEIMDAIKVTMMAPEEIATITDGGWSVTAPVWYLRKIMRNWIDPESSRMNWGDGFYVQSGDRLLDNDRNAKAGRCDAPITFHISPAFFPAIARKKSVLP